MSKSTQQLNLFSPLVKESDFHPNFKRIYSSPYFQCHRDCIQRWTEGFIDRDNKIIKEFQTTFNSSFWEFYLFNLFKEYGFNVAFDEHPDFLLKNSNKEIAVEAVVANNAQMAIPEWEINGRLEKIDDLCQDFTAFNQDAIIRLSNSIISKYKLYLNTYSKLTSVRGKPFVIAIAPFHSQFSYFCADVPIRALLYDYYVDEAALKKQPQLYPDNRPPTVHLKSVKKNDTVEIPLGLFNDNNMSEVSAILFNPVATMGKVCALCKESFPHCDYYRIGLSPSGDVYSGLFSKNDFEETIFSGLQVYHNPYAKYKIPDDFFKNPEVIQCFGYGDDDTLLYDHYDNILMARFVHRFENS